MSFQLRNLKSLNATIEIVDGRRAMKNPAKILAEKLDMSSLRQIKNLDLDVHTRMPLPLYEFGQRLPVATLTRKNIRVHVSTKEILLSIGTPDMVLPSGKEKFITKSTLDDSSMIINRLLLEIGGFGQETELRVTSSSAYAIDRRTPNLNHLLSEERFSASSKLRMGLEVLGGVFLFKLDEMADVVDFKVEIEVEYDEESDKYSEWICTLTEQFAVKSIDFSEIVAKIAELSKKAAAVLGV
ncbi:MAG: hypothetical protein DRO87_03630 [Candidatus Thorarchaeota archaeon]|nr:MAG: hypothetical protein DRP09_05825 [Candidatus Thorarchaeota archaeon]RLI59215.1 MAG: hypothetical protein DRO87_03630 [Candidatus Thorarchaeota archaeon]